MCLDCKESKKEAKIKENIKKQRENLKKIKLLKNMVRKKTAIIHY